MARGHSPLIVLYISAIVSVNAVIWRTTSGGTGNETVKGMILGFLFAQASLLTLWLVAGSGMAVVRLAVVLAAALGLAGLVAPITLTSWYEWFGALCLFGLALATPLCVVGTLGLRLVADGATTEPTIPNLLGQRWQFSLRTGFFWITGFCIVMGAMRGIGFPIDYSMEVGSHCLGLTIIALATLWVVFGPGPSVVRVLSLSLATPMAGWTMGLLGERPGMLATMATIHMLGVALGAAVVRMSGVHVQGKAAT